MQLAEETGITQKSAWLMLQRIREACGGNDDFLDGIVEIDESVNEGNVKHHAMGDKEALFDKAIGRRLAYKKLIAG